MPITTEIVFTALLDGCYLRENRKNKLSKRYTVYKGVQVAKFFASNASVKKFRHLLKTDSKNRMTLNLTVVRQQHGNSFFKQQYKILQNGKTN